MKARSTRAALAAALTLVTAGCLAANAAAIPIVDPGLPSLPDFSGKAAKERPIPRSHPEQNPFMAKDPRSNIHNDSWMTDSYRYSGPLGRDLETQSEAKPPSLCGSLAFDKQGRIVTVCPSAVAPPQARIIDPDTLETIDSLNLPQAPDPPGTKTYQNFSGGGYFYLDNRDRIVVPTKTDHVYVISQGADGETLTVVRDYDLTGVLDTATERITSALPDYDGRIWFVTKANGKIGTIDRKTGEVKVLRTGEEIQNSFAVASEGVYVVSDKRMYRLRASKGGRPRIVWKAPYENSGIVKPSQVNAGSGTTPTIMDGGYVAITDNDAPRMNVVVYRTDRKLRGKKRKVCEVPVFAKGKSATENTILGAGRSLIVENNYGYQDPFGPTAGAITEPGFARVDLKKNGNGCRRVWTNREVRAPSVVPKISTKAGLIYTYSRPADGLNEGYYWTAIDFRTGKTKWMKYSGSGIGFNNNYAGLALGRDGTAYLGTIGGMIALRDGS